MTADFEPTIPPSRTHPTIYMVTLGVAESKLWEADANYRWNKTSEWRQKALALGKKTIEVHGRYCQLATIQTEE